MTAADDPVIVQGLAAIVTSLAEMDSSDVEVREQLGSWLHRMPITTNEIVPVLRAAAIEVGRQPQPFEEPAEAAERRRQIYAELGAPTVEDRLVAALRARDLLEQVADELEQQ